MNAIATRAYDASSVSVLTSMEGHIVRKNEMFRQLKVLWEWALEPGVRSNGRTRIFRCECQACKRKVDRSLRQLITIKPQTCGCLRYATGCKSATKTHDLSHHPLYGVWKGMRARCYRETRKDFRNYGGRGITVCDEWQTSFLSFYNWHLAKGWYTGCNLELDRKDNDGNYCPDNCRLVTQKRSARNRSTSTRVIFRGRLALLIDVWEKFGGGRVLYRTVQSRVNNGWGVEEAMTTPLTAQGPFR